VANPLQQYMQLLLFWLLAECAWTTMPDATAAHCSTACSSICKGKYPLLHILALKMARQIVINMQPHLCTTLRQMSADTSAYDARTNHYYLGHGFLRCWVPGCPQLVCV
jgi:hypothetical protein